MAGYKAVYFLLITNELVLFFFILFFFNSFFGKYLLWLFGNDGFNSTEFLHLTFIGKTWFKCVENFLEILDQYGT